MFENQNVVTGHAIAATDHQRGLFCLFSNQISYSLEYVYVITIDGHDSRNFIIASSDLHVAAM